MALDEFWRNVKIAASLLWPDVLTDAPDIDSDRLARRLRSAAMWLTPATMEGFDPEDFKLLSPSEREDLKESVEGFRRIAEQVPDDGPARQEQVEEALPKLRRILGILRPDRNPDVDAFRTAKVLENLRLPDDVRDDVVRIFPEFDTDWTGEPMTLVWVILKDEVADRPTFFEETDRIQRAIEGALRRQGDRLHPRVRFRTVSEQMELTRSGRK
jgi:hypothetical protein